MTADDMEKFLIGWFNRNAAGSARHIPFSDRDDTGLVLMAFSLHQLAHDLVTESNQPEKP